MNTKKILAVILALAAVITVFAACGGNEGGEAAASKFETPEAVLDTVWAKFNETVEEENKFEPIGGLDYSKAGVADKLDLADVETLAGTFGFPEAEVANVDAIASMMHAMNGNVFTAVAFHVAEGADMTAIAESYKTALAERQWFCGMPDGYALIKADSEYMIAIYAQQPLEGYKTAALAAIEGAEIVAEESFA